MWSRGWLAHAPRARAYRALVPARAKVSAITRKITSGLIKLIKFIKPTRMECAETRKLRDRRLSACSRARLGRYFVGTIMKNFLMRAVPSALRFDKIS